ncbi:hypothetical protein CSIRO_1781 [Bradyrhizobiaceae bacterium SG-6C]|nr:hypothetical protein CSIRO_1781 [Bradyrhizobiaceae bacterium SG-6C]
MALPSPLRLSSVGGDAFPLCGNFPKRLWRGPNSDAIFVLLDLSIIRIPCRAEESRVWNAGPKGRISQDLYMLILSI